LIKEEGPDHKKEFTIEVYLGNDLMGLGLGKTKKSAEQEASRIALEKLKEL
jgi:ribonuclease-3